MQVPQLIFQAPESVTHHGKHFHFDDARASVQPKQDPRPPIWLGGDVEAAVRRAARIADAWCVAPTLSTETMLRFLSFVFPRHIAPDGAQLQSLVR